MGRERELQHWGKGEPGQEERRMGREGEQTTLRNYNSENQHFIYYITNINYFIA